MNATNRWADTWKQFTPTMKATFRAIARNGHRLKRHIPGATWAALRRHRVVYEDTFGSKTKYVYINANGCDLMDWLRSTKQVTRDKE